MVSIFGIVGEKKNGKKEDRAGALSKLNLRSETRSLSLFLHAHTHPIGAVMGFSSPKSIGPAAHDRLHRLEEAAHTVVE